MQERRRVPYEVAQGEQLARPVVSGAPLGAVEGQDGDAALLADE